MEKIHSIPVGADENVFEPLASNIEYTITEEFKVLFYGSFLPLHGVDIILNAALMLKEYNIVFTLIGGGRIDLTTFHAISPN